MVDIWPIGSTDLSSWIRAVLNTGLVALAISWFVERLPGWQKPPTWLLLRLSPEQGGWLVKLWPPLKMWSLFVVAVALPTLVTIFYYGAGPEFMAQRYVWGEMALQGLVLWAFTQAAHVVDPKRLIEFMGAVIKYGPMLLRLVEQSRGASGLSGGTANDDSIWTELIRRAG